MERKLAQVPRSEYSYPEFFAAVHPELLIGRESDRTEPSSNGSNRERGEVLDDMYAGAHPAARTANGELEAADNWIEGRGYERPVQTKTCVQEQLSGKTGRFYIPESTFEPDEMLYDGIMNFIVLDYEGGWDGDTEVEVLMDVSVPAFEVGYLLEDRSDAAGVLKVENRSAEGWTLRYDRVVEMVEDIYGSLDRSFEHDAVAGFYTPIAGARAPEYDPESN